jgi:hypothetical protein
MVTIFEYMVTETSPTCVGYLIELVSKQKKVRFRHEKFMQVHDGGSTVELMCASPKSVQTIKGLCNELDCELGEVEFSHHDGYTEIAEFVAQWPKFVELIIQTVAGQSLDFRRQATFSANILSKKTPDTVYSVLVDSIYVTIKPIFDIVAHPLGQQSCELTRNCKCCDRRFTPKNRKGVYCSDKCRLKDYRQNHSRSKNEDEN